MRRDPLTGAWIIYAPERGERPGAPGPGMETGSSGPGTTRRNGPRRSPDCPFCPGNEERLPEIVLERARPEAPGWSARVVANLYPVVRPAPEAGADGSWGPYERAGAAGRHEVIVESPRHDVDLSDLSDPEVEDVLGVYRERAAAAERDGLRPVPFRNRGASAGASQRHPHGQLVAMAVPPPLFTELEARVERHHERTGRCLLCELADSERDGGRILFERDGALAFVPYAAHPYEVWVFPPHGDSWAAPSGAASAIAAALAAALRALRDRGGDPDYNMLVHSPPADAPAAIQHWHLRIRPRLLTPAGLELATGVAVSPVLPEESARVLTGP